MGWAAMPLAIAGTAAGTFMSAKSAQEQGAFQQSQMEWQAYGAERAAAEAEEQAAEVMTQAAQEETNRMMQLESMLAGNKAATAASGITSDSASVEAINSRARQIADVDIGNVKYMGTAQAKRLGRQASADRDAANMYRGAGWQARSSANTAMWGSIFKGISSVAMFASTPTMGNGAGRGGSPWGGSITGSSPV